MGSSDESRKPSDQQVTICLSGGAVLGPFRAVWSKETLSDVRELVREYDAFLGGEPQKRFKFHLHDRKDHVAHTLVLDFRQVTAIYDKVELLD